MTREGLMQAWGARPAGRRWPSTKAPRLGMSESSSRIRSPGCPDETYKAASHDDARPLCSSPEHGAPLSSLLDLARSRWPCSRCPPKRTRPRSRACSRLWERCGSRPRRSATTGTAPPLDRGAALLGVGGATLCLQLTCRLGAAAHFGGRWQRFDFGVKCAKDEADCDERNRAFTPHFNSFGHCAQGALSALLVPSVERALAARVVGGRAGVVAASAVSRAPRTTARSAPRATRRASRRARSRTTARSGPRASRSA